jgi:hypothetical protein
MAIDECRKLNLTKHTPTALIWNSKLPVDQPFLHGGYLMMPMGLNGRILPEDAGPLIMSAIIQQKLVKRRNPPNRYFALLVVLWLVGLFGSIAILALAGALGPGPMSDNIGSAVGLGWFVLLIFGSFLLNFRNNRVQRLESDLQVAQLIGRDAFSQTLRKIENLNLSPQQGRIRSLMSGWPSLSQRITNLDNPTLPVTEKDAFEAFQKKWGLNPKPSPPARKV